MRILNWIDGAETPSAGGTWLDKHDPHTGRKQSEITASNADDVATAVAAAERAFPVWSALTPVARGQQLTAIARLMGERSAELADCIASETGKPPKDARGEVGGAIMQAEYFAGEGMRLYGRTLTSSMAGRSSHTVRQPLGVAGLIVPANTPIANIAWKCFPALICGNTVVLKAAEDSPRIANLMARLMADAGLPAGVLNVVHGAGAVAGAAVVEHPRVAVISFTGSTAVGRWIAEMAGKRLARVSLELGGKNPFVVCDDADLPRAAHWALLSAFSNAGQRCAAGSRILVFEQVYGEFRDALVRGAKKLTLGVGDGSDLGPVINKRQHAAILEAIALAQREGGKVLCGGGVPSDASLASGYYVEPTIVDGLPPSAQLCRREVFGPVVTLQPVRDMAHALELANDTEYGLTAAIHTKNVDRAMWFAQRVRSGVANVNLGTYGSEPHMPFGGFSASGNGTREPGVEALSVYSELKNISILTRADLV
jgi:alpha-ketoglutaric semialdehyde dehydrogenase